MNKPPDLSVIIPWRNRKDIGVSLERNSEWIRRYAREVIIVNCGGKRDMLIQLTANVGLEGGVFRNVDR